MTIPSEAEILETMRAHLARIVPDVELRLKAPVVRDILTLKAERHAVILGHNYMEPALFLTIPDHRGDSLELCRRAATTDHDPIVFCGVRFMAETAKILNPGKRVLLPAKDAGCSLAESITAADVRALKARYPGAPVVVYVNTYADVKAEADYCCTSGNAAALIGSLDAETIVFLPDEYLARNVARETGKHIVFPSLLGAADVESEIDVQLVGWRGRCEVHERFTVEDVASVRRQFPDVVVLAHPECSPEVVAASDVSGSTAQMIRFLAESRAPRFLLLTECAMGDNVAAAHPDKELLRLCSVRCPHMNQITLEDTRDALRLDRYAVEVPEEIRHRAARSLERMLAFG